MSIWTEQEFQRVARGTKLSERTLAACREVLIEGVPGIEAAAKYKMFPAQISRSLGTLRDRQAQMIRSAEELMLDGAMLKFAAVHIAKSLMGDGFACVDAQVGKTYVGPIVVVSHGFAVQKVGRGGVTHDTGQLDKVPPKNGPLSISYPPGGGKATVEAVNAEKAKEKGVGR